jgi:hypothetical protein
MGDPPFPWKRLFLYVALSLLDLLLTWMLVQYSEGKVLEGNPIAGAWLARYGWPGVAIFKLMALALVTGVTVVVRRRQPHTADRLLTFGCLVVAGVVIYSYYLLAHVFP